MIRFRSIIALLEVVLVYYIVSNRKSGSLEPVIYAQVEEWQLHEVVGERGMKPHEDGEVSLDPSGVVGARGVVVPVRQHIKMSEGDAEGIPPAPVGIGLHIISDGH
jgi:hypothetical protein